MTSLIDVIEQQSGDQRAADLALYCELLLADEGKAADAKRLDQVRARLGKSLEDMRADQVVLREAADLEPLHHHHASTRPPRSPP